MTPKPSVLAVVRATLAVWATFGVAADAAAQLLPSEPVTFADGRVVVSGELSAAFGSSDPGFFNYSDYEHSTLRQFRVTGTALVRATDRIAFLADVRSDNLHALTPFALYARIRPMPGRRLDIQIGRIPPTFGRFSRQAYGRDNPLIGYPLAFQYLTSLRADAIPESPDELIRMRARGWLANYSIGNLEPARGVPLVSALSWDTGVQITTGWKTVTMTGAVTNGTASNPRVSDDNGGKQVAARVAVAASPAISVGASFAHGQFLSRHVVAALADTQRESHAQQAYGADLEYARGHFVARAEGVLSEWRMPFRGTGTVETLRALGLSAEGRYAFMPGAYLAARVERLGFSRIRAGGRLLTWDAPVRRIEVGGGYLLQRNLMARGSLQFNDRPVGRVQQARLVAAQLLYWF